MLSKLSGEGHAKLKEEEIISVFDIKTEDGKKYFDLRET